MVTVRFMGCTGPQEIGRWDKGVGATAETACEHVVIQMLLKGQVNTF